MVGRGPRTKLPVTTLLSIDSLGDQEYFESEDSEDNTSDNDDNNSNDDDNNNDDDSEDEESKEEIETEISEFKLLGVTSKPEFTAVAWFKEDGGKLSPNLFFNQGNQVFRFDFDTKKSSGIFKGTT